MKKTLRFAFALLIGLLPLGATDPTVTWNSPGEGSCRQIDAAQPNLELSVSAADPGGIKQGIMWMKAGHLDWTSDRGTWMQIWGHTYAHDGVGPTSVNETITVRMLGRAVGEYSFIVEFADMASHDTGTKLLHVSIDSTAPTVAVTSPLTGRAVCRDKNLSVNVAASDAGCGIGQVQLYLNEVTPTTPVSVDTLPPYLLIVPKEMLAVDSLRIIVKAIDKSGRSSLAEVTVRPTMICLMRRAKKEIE